jgi:hypothetical protein
MGFSPKFITRSRGGEKEAAEMPDPVRGNGNGGIGVFGTSDSNIGVHGRCFGNNAGVLGISADGVGVHGESRGIADTGGDTTGVLGRSNGGFGVHGESVNDVGVHGRCINDDTGVFGLSKGGRGVHGHATDPKGVGVFGQGTTAGRFLGDVVVENGDVRLTGADCAEEFDVVETEIVEPGTVMVLGEESELRPSYKEYDKRVAGVISGAGDYRPGLVLDKQPSQRKRQPIALLGKAYCKVDAEYAPIEIGDLLTTSPTQGHAMKATDPLKAFGTVIGKALRPVMEAQNLISILITLQ